MNPATAKEGNFPTVQIKGQIEGYYGENIYKLVDRNGEFIPADLGRHGGNLMSYTPLTATGYLVQSRDGVIFKVRQIDYDDRIPDTKIRSNEGNIRNVPVRTENTVIVDRDPGYFHGKLVSNNAGFYESNPGAVKNLSGYSLLRDVSQVRVGAKVIVLGNILSSGDQGLMNFRTAENDMISVRLNGAIIPMGQRVYLYGTVLGSGILSAEYIISIA